MTTAKQAIAPWCRCGHPERTGSPTKSHTHYPTILHRWSGAVMWAAEESFTSMDEAWRAGRRLWLMLDPAKQKDATVLHIEAQVWAHGEDSCGIKMAGFVYNPSFEVPPWRDVPSTGGAS